MTQLGAEVVKTMQKHHHELTSARDRIAEILADEEAKFEKTLANGLKVFHERISVVLTQRLELIAISGSFSALPLTDTKFSLAPTSALSCPPSRRSQIMSQWIADSFVPPHSG